MGKRWIGSCCDDGDSFCFLYVLLQMLLLHEVSGTGFPGSIIGFLIFGPMMDIKNLIMLFSSFRKTFVIKLVLVITILSFVLLYFLTFLLM